MSEVMSVRVADDVARMLREEATVAGEPVSRLVQGLIDEGLRMRRHPGIVFRGGPTVRKAGVPRGADVWEIVGLIRSLDARGDAAIEETARWLSIPASAVRAALAYYGEFAHEIDSEIEANDRAAERLQENIERQQRALG